MTRPRVIYWFRTDLRLHDSPALRAALDLKPEAFWPIFTWDPHYNYRARGGVNRFQFLLDCQNDLSRSITKLNPRSRLFVLREGPQTLLPKLFKAWGVTHLVFERDTDSYARGRDDAVIAAAARAGVEVVTRYGRTLWDSDEVVRKNGGRPTMSITQLQAAGQKIGPVPDPIPAPDRLPDPGEMPLDFGQEEPEPDPDFNAQWRSLQDKGYAKLAGPGGDFAVATLEELGFQAAAATTPHRGGETLALERLDAVIVDTKYAATFRKPRTSPAAFEPQSTTLLSPFLHFGALSPRLFYHRAQDAVDKYRGRDASAPPESLTGQLLFRDMYFAAQAAIGPAFGQTAGNAHCRFVPWHLPSRLEPEPEKGPKGQKGKHQHRHVTGMYEVDSAQADAWFRRWRAGQTGFPWIDALMRQLRAEGWIHHLGRHAVACFLTRGGCYVSWERGAEVFEELLLDHEPACNAGNWQWLSCTAFFSQYYRCYSPVSFGRKWDPDGAFVRRWVPELRGLDAAYIYEPWRAPIPDQRRAGVRVVPWTEDILTGVEVEAEPDGNDENKNKKEEEKTYPKPMFDFSERRRICLASMKQAFSVGLHGDDERVLDGSWRELFTADDAGGDGDAEVQGDLDCNDHGENADEAGEDDEHRPPPPHGHDRKSKGSLTGGMPPPPPPPPSKRVARQGTLDRHVKKRKG